MRLMVWMVVFLAEVRVGPNHAAMRPQVRLTLAKDVCWGIGAGQTSETQPPATALPSSRHQPAQHSSQHSGRSRKPAGEAATISSLQLVDLLHFLCSFLICSLISISTHLWRGCSADPGWPT